MIVKEGGNATSKWGTVRANQRDIQTAVRKIASVLGVPDSEIQAGLLGSTEMTLLGYKDDSGDIDIALQADKFDMQQTHEKMVAAVDGEGVLMPGIKVASYAVPTSADKKVQVDLMFFDNSTYAKFMYHSDEGRESKYKGMVRNILMIAIVRHMMKPGDVVIKDDDGKVIAQAKYSLDIPRGIKRSYKIAPIGRSGERVKTLKAVEPNELAAELEKIDPNYKNITINTASELINDPNAVAEFVFGPGVAAKDVMTTEQALTLFQKTDRITPQQKSTIAMDVVTTLERAGVDYPPVLDKIASSTSA
jgi:hypothetical protein